MNEKHEAIDATETLLAHLLCAENDDASNNLTGAKRGVSLEEVDAGSILRFDIMRPKMAHTFDMMDGDRLFTMDHNLLITSVPDILGMESEVAIMKDGYCQWVGYRRLAKAPRNIWVGGKIGAIYEAHWRTVFPDGRSHYFRRCAAVSPKGAALPCLIQGTRNSGSGNVDGNSLVLSASIIEDASRTGCFTASVRDTAGIIFPVPYGAQIELFKLRDGPMTQGGRRKAILHWVAKHIRRRGDAESAVREHIRGVHEFTVDGLNVRLTANDVQELTPPIHSVAHQQRAA